MRCIIQDETDAHAFRQGLEEAVQNWVDEYVDDKISGGKFEVTTDKEAWYVCFFEVPCDSAPIVSEFGNDCDEAVSKCLSAVRVLFEKQAAEKLREAGVR